MSLDEFVPRYGGDELLNFGDFPVNHVAICTGARADGDHVLLHASTVDGTNALWPLRRFDDYDQVPPDVRDPAAEAGVQVPGRRASSSSTPASHGVKSAGRAAISAVSASGLAHRTARTSLSSGAGAPACQRGDEDVVPLVLDALGRGVLGAVAEHAGLGERRDLRRR